MEQARGRTGIPVTALKTQVGISRAQWDNLIKAQVERPQARTLDRIEKAFSWPTGSITAYLNDGGPEPAPVGVVTLPGGEGQANILALLRTELDQDATGRLQAEVLRIVADSRDPGNDTASD